ncbi:MAG: DUF2764 family protein [Myxococcales bacterium]|nr:DUF2764 family protein [Myxococcales bacterium]
MSPRFGGIYYTLMASLPALPEPAQAKRTPISRPRLDQRLAMLPDEDRATVDQVEHFLRWARQPLESTDAEAIELYDTVRRTSTNAVVRELFAYRFDFRVVIAGLRARLRGWEPLTIDHPIAAQLRRNWEEPSFGLGYRFPWIESVRALLEQRDSMAVERLLLHTAWRHLSDLELGRYFSLEALIIYLAKWDIVARIAGHDAEAGRRRFDSLVAEAYGGATH